MTHKERFFKKLEHLEWMKDWYISEMMNYNKQFITNIRARNHEEATYKRYCKTLDDTVDKISRDILESKDV